MATRYRCAACGDLVKLPQGDTAGLAMGWAAASIEEEEGYR